MVGSDLCRREPCCASEITKVELDAVLEPPSPACGFS